MERTSQKVLSIVRKKMVYFLLFNIFLTGAFAQKWYFPQGISWGAGRILVADTDKDGNKEFIFNTYGNAYDVFVYELHLPDSFEVDTFSYLPGLTLWDGGDFDLDGLHDLVLHVVPSFGINSISIAESPDSFSYPTEEVWRDTMGPSLVVPICAFDIDKDGIPEIVKNLGSPYGDLVILESIGDNQYEIIFADNPDTTGYDGPSSTEAFGDFDGDGNIEFVMGATSSGGYFAPYWVYESPADNTYEKVNEGDVQTKNIKDCFAVDDADGDGKPEFVVKGFTVIGPPSHEIHTFIFEATGDNTYEPIKTFTKTYTGSNYFGGHSASGDVDGDGKPEIILEAATMIWGIEAVENDSFVYFASFAGYPTGSDIAIHDMDGNGLAEVIISGNNETRIYEYVPPGIEESFDIAQKCIVLKTYPNPFTNRLRIQISSATRSTFSTSIHDVAGRLVKSLGRETGNFMLLEWDGSSNLRMEIAEGVYFLCVEDIINKSRYYTKIIKIAE